MSSIEWTDETWNPITGCKKVSPGCANCYAESIAKRFWGERKFTEVQFHPERLDQPLKWRKPRMVFVNSMSDLFHESVTDEQLDQVFAVMALTPQHTYQVLTKRPERMLKYFQQFSERAKDWGGDSWLIHEVAIGIVGEDELHDGKYQDQKMLDLPLPNVWLGVTVENQKAAEEHIPLLLQTPAAVRFLSCEPLLEDIDLANAMPLGGPDLDWVIVGGESGHNARPCDVAWIHSIVEQCKAAGVPCFVKQLGSKPFWSRPNPFSDPSKSYRDLEFQPHRATWTGTVYSWQSTGKGNNPDEWPESLRVRQMPSVGV